MTFNQTIRFSLVPLVMLASSALPAEDSLSPTTSDENKADSSFQRWIEFYTEVAEKYHFRLQGSSMEELEFHPVPVQTYSHPSGLEGTHGAFFVWTRNNRPEVVGSIWSYEFGQGRRTLVHEFDSLSVTPLAATKVGRSAWTPKSGIQPRPIPDAPIPRTSRRQRRLQIRGLAKRFEGYTTSAGGKVKLRLLPRPLYQSNSVNDKTDSALFCLFDDWDPEIILLIESRPTEIGPRWHYSAARFNICPMWLEYQGVRVWEKRKAPQTVTTFGDPNGPFFAVHQPGALPAWPGEEKVGVEQE